MKRANAPQQKAERRQHILAAAESCFLENGHKLPSAAEVAKAANVAKGTVYLYFHSKEEIFLAMFQEKLSALLRLLFQPTEEPIDQFIATQVGEYLSKEPGFLPLAAMLQSILEMNLKEETLYQFKLGLSSALREAGAHLDSTFNFPNGFSEQALIFSYSGLIGLWQMLQWPQALANQLDEEAFKPLRRDLDTELKVLFTRIWIPNT